MQYLLSITIFLPLVGAILLLFFPRVPDEADPHSHGHEHGEATEQVSGAATGTGAANAVRFTALLFALGTFVLSILLLVQFDSARRGFQLMEGPDDWIEQ